MGRRKKAIGINDFLGRTFVTLPFTGDWLAHIGQPEKNFKACIYGKSGQGKTAYVVKLAKYLTNFGKVAYNSKEEGVSRSLQMAFARENMEEVNGKLILLDGDSFEEMFDRMGRKNSPQFMIIDSIDFLRFTHDQYVKITEAYPHKSFIFISWAAGKNPKSEAGKKIEYSCDLKITVHDKMAYAAGRFGGIEPFDVWPEYNEKKRLAAEEKAKSAAALRAEAKAANAPAPAAAPKPPPEPAELPPPPPPNPRRRIRGNY